MHRTLGILTAALAIALFAPALTQAGGARQTGTVVAVAEEMVTFKGADGKTYEIKEADVVAEDLRTGDIVEYEIVEGGPVKVTKKKK
jgi:hypothetical protein